MAKKIVGYVKLNVPAGKANPSPPIGPALGQRGLNIMEFCKAFNAQTQKVEPGLPLLVEKPYPLVGAPIGLHGLRAHECRREHHLPTENEAVHVEVVAPQLPTPRFG